MKNARLSRLLEQRRKTRLPYLLTLLGKPLEWIFRFLERPSTRAEESIDQGAVWLGPRCYWIAAEIHHWTGKGIAASAAGADRLAGLLTPRIRLAILLAVMAFVGVNLGCMGRDWLLGKADFQEGVLILLGTTDWFRVFDVWAAMMLWAGLACALAIPLLLISHRLVLFCLRVVGSAYTALWVYFLFILTGVPSDLFSMSKRLFNQAERNMMWVEGTLPWLALLMVMLLLLYSTATRQVIAALTPPRDGKEPLGDRIRANLVSHGKDPNFRKALWWAGYLHVFIFIWPLLMRGCMETPYAIPKGSGNPVVAMVQKVQPKKKPEKKLLLSPNSPFIFERLKMDASKVLTEVVEVTQDTYQASDQKGGKLGRGGGTRGGWPNGMDGAIRFIRIKYNGGDWDQDMGQGADYNVLVELQKATGFRIAQNTEFKEVSQLRLFPKKRAPPFVFITGKGSINMSPRDIKTLRWYCLEEGGMIFADNGGGNFDAAINNLIQRVFPDRQWTDIANDDIIFRQPYSFPYGAPPLWHHAGSRAKGISHEGRWVAFYHPGDLNDAWKTGHSGVSDMVAQQAYRMAFNVISYSFNQYLSFHFGEDQ